MCDFAIVVGDHAREQARSRFPGFKSARIVDEVRAAIAEGRLSARLPADVRISSVERKRCLYAWTPDGRRVYALRSGDAVFYVATTLSTSGLQ